MKDEIWSEHKEKLLFEMMVRDEELVNKLCCSSEIFSVNFATQVSDWIQFISLSLKM